MNRLDNNSNQQQSSLAIACKLGLFKAASLIITHPIDRFTINNLATKFSISAEYIKDMYKGISFSVCHSMTKFLGVRTPAMSMCQHYELSAVSSAVIIASCDIITGVTPLQRAKIYHVTSQNRSISSNLKDMLAQKNNLSALRTIYHGSMLKLFADSLSWTMFFYADNLLKEKFKNKSTASYISCYFFVLAVAEFILCPIKNTLIEMQANKKEPIKITDAPNTQAKSSLWRGIANASNTKQHVDNLYRSHGLKVFWRRYPSHLSLATIRVGLTSITMSALEQNKKSGELTR